MTPRKLFWVQLGGLVLMLALLVGSCYAISSTITKKSQQLVDSRTTVDTLTAQQSGLAKSKQEISKYQDLARIAKTLVPQDKDQAEAVREIAAIATANGISLTTVGFPASTLGTTGGAAAKPGAAAAPAANSKAGALSQLTPVPTIPGVYSLQITIGNNAATAVSFNQLDAFLRGLENNRRTAEVSSLSIQPDATKPDQLTFSLIVNDYIKPS